jgi:tRNA A-37 threonylcarbamoyl transferase component Bud32
MDLEARTMEYARASGFPAPAVEELREGGSELVMEHLGGLSMLGALEKRPWRLRRYAAVLADLQCRLNALPAPSWLHPAPCGEGERLLHLDLHPLNVMMTARGPVVIDWTNAAKGEPAVDVAVSWTLLAVGAIPGGRVKAAAIGLLRSALVSSYLSHFDLTEVRRRLCCAVEWKCRDPNMRPSEQRAMRDLAHRHGIE